MTPREFDPEKFIDREFETELFENLLQFNDQARILAIKDKRGMGKSHLLAKLQYRCRVIKPRIPVSFIPLDQLEDARPYGLVNRIAQDLQNMALEFPDYALYNGALRLGDFKRFLTVMDLRSANFAGAQGARFSGTNLNFENVESVVYEDPVPFSPQQQGFAEEGCITAFFNDLTKSAAETPVVLMFDAYEKCEEKLQAWIEEYLLDKYFFNLEQRPKKLLLVLAGREVPAFENRWGVEDSKTVVSFVKELRKWKREHIEALLRVHGFVYSEEQLDLVAAMSENDTSPSMILEVIHFVFNRA